MGNALRSDIFHHGHSGGQSNANEDKAIVTRIYLPSDENKVYLSDNDDIVLKNGGFFINQKDWIPHVVSWSLVKLKNEVFLILLWKYLYKTKWKISIKCKRVFEWENIRKIAEFLKDEMCINDPYVKHLIENKVNTKVKNTSNTVDKLLFWI